MNFEKLGHDPLCGLCIKPFFTSAPTTQNCCQGGTNVLIVRGLEEGKWMLI